jgi:hypothetical protein
MPEWPLQVCVALASRCGRGFDDAETGRDLGSLLPVADRGGPMTAPVDTYLRSGKAA